MLIMDPKILLLDPIEWKEREIKIPFIGYVPW